MVMVDPDGSFKGIIDYRGEGGENDAAHSSAHESLFCSSALGELYEFIYLYIRMLCVRVCLTEGMKFPGDH